MAKRIIAVIYIGSIAANMKVVEVGSKGKPKVIETIRKYISLGSQGYTLGIIGQEQVNEICECLINFGVKYKEYRVNKVFCVATSAFREAGNKEVVLEQIRIKTGITVDILGNSMERFYNNTAVKESIPGFEEIIKQGTMMLDIGSGSMQATVYDKSEFVFSQNTVLGSLRISNMLSDLQNRTVHYEDVMEEFIAQDLNDYHNVEPKDINYKTLIAFGGEVEYIKNLMNKDNDLTIIITKSEFMAVYEYLLKTRPSDLTLNNNIPAGCAPLLLPTALIIRNMLEYTGLDKLYLPSCSMLEGVVYEYAYKELKLKPKINPANDYINAAKNIAKRYKTDRKHIELVEKMALHIFDATKNVTGLGKHDRFLLQLATILHEIGKFVDSKNHTESAYALIRYTDLVGLDEKDLDIISLTVKLYPKENPYIDPSYFELSFEKKIIVSKLMSILRIADALDASHRQKIKKISVQVVHGIMTISCEVNGDVSFEEWSFEHRSLVFKDVIGVEPQIKLRRKL